MEIVLAILQVLGIFIVLPALVGFAIVGFVLLWQSRVRAKLGNAELESKGREALSGLAP